MKTKPNTGAKLVAAFFAASAIVVAVGCNEIDILTDCQAICDKYQDCFDADYDVARLNLRDHGDSHHLNDEIFHSCRIAEVVGAV